MRRAVVLACLVPALAVAQAPPRDLVVDQRGPLTTLGAALTIAHDGDRIVVRRGVYREPTIMVSRPVTITADSGAILDGEDQRAIMIVTADNVTVRGFTFRRTGTSHLEDRAALLLRDVRNCTIEGNTFTETYFGIYLQRVRQCDVNDNRLTGLNRNGSGGNGIHVWQSDTVRIGRNTIRAHRDGIYFEFVKHGAVRLNLSELNQRYGLHFMFSDDCSYVGNTFQRNGSGVAVMYTRQVRMTGNTFALNWGSAAYGLLLKDITDSEIRDNRFSENTVGLYLEGANRNLVSDNRFESNGWAIRLLANSQENRVTGNSFTGNSFDVGTNSRQNFSTFSGNVWDRYRGYDLDRDGFGDVPFAPVRLFSLVVEQTPPALILIRSFIVDLLDFAERVMPMLTPQTLIDEKPRMRIAIRGQTR
jgi:nitrous oxidase accessory protein